MLFFYVHFPEAKLESKKDHDVMRTQLKINTVPEEKSGIALELGATFKT